MIILCLLLICYLPSFLFEESLADAIFGSHSDEQLNDASIKAFKIKAIGNRISIVLIYFNCSSNFLIYCICNKKFKNSLKLLLKKSRLNRYYQRARYFLSKRCFRLVYYKQHAAATRENVIVRYSASDQTRDGVFIGKTSENKTTNSSIRSTATLTINSIKQMGLFRSGGKERGEITGRLMNRRGSINTLHTLNSVKLSEGNNNNNGDQ